MRREIKDPLNELLTPAAAGIGEAGADVHNFAGSNPNLFQRGKKYLHNKSGMAYDEKKHGTKAKYVEEYLKPVLTDLQTRIQNGQWDYVGKDYTAGDKRNSEKKSVIDYLERLKDEYHSSPTDAAAEEFVMFHHILQQEPASEKEGSPFIILFEVIIESLVANGETPSCKPGIMERIIRDAAAKEKSEKETVRVVETGFDAMQAYHKEYLNSFCMEDTSIDDIRPSKLLRDIATYHIANRFAELDNPDEESVDAAYKQIKGDVKKSLAKYTQAMGLPEVCSQFDYETDKKLDQKILAILTDPDLLGFFFDRNEEIGLIL